MAYQIHQDQQDSLVTWLRFYDQLTWDEYLQAFDSLVEQIRARNERIDVILNAEIPVPQENPLPHFQRVIKQLAEVPNLGIFVSVNPDAGTFARMMVDLLTRIYAPKLAGRFPFVTTIDQAWQRIEAARRTRFASAR